MAIGPDRHTSIHLPLLSRCAGLDGAAHEQSEGLRRPGRHTSLEVGAFYHLINRVLLSVGGIDVLSVRSDSERAKAMEAPWPSVLIDLASISPQFHRVNKASVASNQGGFDVHEPKLKNFADFLVSWLESDIEPHGLDDRAPVLDVDFDEFGL